MIASGKWKQRKQKYQYAHTSDPVRKASPYKNTMRKNFDIREDAGTGGCKSGYGLKKCIYRIWNRRAYNKRNGTKNTECKPAQSYRDTAVFRIKNFVPGLFESQWNSDNKADYHGNQECKKIIFMVNKCGDTGQYHKNCLKVTYPADNISDYWKIHLYTLLLGKNIADIAKTFVSSNDDHIVTNLNGILTSWNADSPFTCKAADEEIVFQIKL